MQIETDQYLARLIGPKDGEVFFQLINQNKSRLEDYFAGTVAKTNTLKDTKAYCIKIETLLQDKSYFPFLIIEKESQKAVGLFDFKNVDWNVPKVEIGAFIDSEFEGYGIISKIGTQLIDLMVKQFQFKKVYCRAAAENERSIKAILNYGFELEGTLRRDYKTTSGRLVDLKLYGKLFD